jgi:superfamily II DNA or RNA helicase
VSAVQRVKYTLYPHQQRAINEIEQAFADGHHAVMVQSPTGSGKGVMLSHIINECHEKGLTVLFLVHLGELIKQTSDYMESYGIEHGIIKAGTKQEDEHPVQLASFQTICRRLKNPHIRQADVMIIDEAHHATAPTFLKVIEHYKKNRVIGFSATPSRQNGMGLGNLFDVMISVETIKALTDQGFLAPVRIYGPVSPDLAGVKISAGDYQKDQLEGAMLAGGLVGDIVGHWMKFGDNRQTIVFATGVKHSVAICLQFRAEGIAAEHIDGKTDKDERKAIMDRFKAGTTQVLVNCQVLTEGVDVPNIGCVILARPTKSLNAYLQMAGRGMRTAPNKEYCILLDHAGAVHEHGFPDETVEWSLDVTSKAVNKANEKRKREKSEPIKCPVCDLVYTARLDCPGCGNVPTPKQIGKDVDYIDGTLGEIIRKGDNWKAPKAVDPHAELKASWLAQFKKHEADRGCKDGWARINYKEKFGEWPPYSTSDSVRPANELSVEVRAYIQSRNIAYRKAQDAARVQSSFRSVL